MSSVLTVILAVHRTALIYRLAPGQHKLESSLSGRDSHGNRESEQALTVKPEAVRTIEKPPAAQ